MNLFFIPKFGQIFTPQKHAGFSPSDEPISRDQFKTQRIDKSKSNNSGQVMAPHSVVSGLDESEITPELHSKINQLKNEIGHEYFEMAPWFDTDFSMLRWLYGWDFKFAEIIPRFRQSAMTLRTLKVPDHEIVNEDDFNQIINNLTKCATYFPGGLMGFDRDGNAVFCQALCKISPRTLVRCDRVSELFKMVLTECALTQKMINEREQKTHKKLGLRIIMDLEGFSMDLIYKPTLKIYMDLIKIMQDCFPDFVKTIYVINSPMMFATVYNLVKPAVAKQTQEKIQFLGKDHKQVLCKEIGAENIYERWGGTKVPTNGIDSGYLRMGGIAPDELKYHPDKNPFHIYEKQLVKVNVGAKNKKEVKMTVERPGAKLHWFFTANNDIDFYILKDGVEVWPKFRLSTEFVPEYNHVYCETAGEYVLTFDNTYGTFFSKEVKFHAHIIYE